MPIEQIDLGLQPKVEMTTDIEKTVTPEGDNIYSPRYEASLVPSTEWRATGKEVHDPEFARLLDDATDHSNQEDWRKNSIFGTDRISTPDGGEIVARNDQIQMLQRQGYGRKVRNPRMTVPRLSWQEDRKPGERWVDFMRRTGQIGKTVMQYSDGRRLVVREEGLTIERTENLNGV